MKLWHLSVNCKAACSTTNHNSNSLGFRDTGVTQFHYLSSVVFDDSFLLSWSHPHVYKCRISHVPSTPIALDQGLHNSNRGFIQVFAVSLLNHKPFTVSPPVLLSIKSLPFPHLLQITVLTLCKEPTSWTEATYTMLLVLFLALFSVFAAAAPTDSESSALSKDNGNLIVEITSNLIGVPPDNAITIEGLPENSGDTKSAQVHSLLLTSSLDTHR